MKLAAGFLFAQGGSVKIDGKDLTSVNLSELYPYIGYLSQEPQIFDGTIQENIAYGNTKHMSDDQIRSALEKAQATFVYDLPF